MAVASGATVSFVWTIFHVCDPVRYTASEDPAWAKYLGLTGFLIRTPALLPVAMVNSSIRMHITVFISHLPAAKLKGD
jgi:hypothetical protein